MGWIGHYDRSEPYISLERPMKLVVDGRTSTRWGPCLPMVAHVFRSSTLEAEPGSFCEFKTSLVYIANSRPLELLNKYHVLNMGVPSEGCGPYPLSWEAGRAGSYIA